ncbi:phosphoinositide phospholipase C 6-like isoform X1 [Musa acuminata AAA Group]|uniref:phosphoinositide phospholipase C 6-like isoform X1 n=1 Tax=Musa acuminata AAA Group TaxID=214697 RepID=UPI0031E24154
MGSYKYCICFTRKFVWRAAAPPPDVRQTFVEYSEGAAQMGPDQLRRFLAEAQGQADATLADAERIIEVLLHRRRRCHHFPAILSRPGISLDDFFHFLFSDDLNLPIGSQVHQDMSLPLSHYYIYTGHNSYLTGNQLSSDSSDIPIIKALQRGVRVIELDMWPNSTKDDVLIYHGRTLTSPVEMIKCLRSIKEFAFCASSYPVVITLEDHLTPDLQAKVAEMVTQTFGDMLYYPKSDSLEEFPSPESLKNRIIISTKPPKKFFESKTVEDKQDDLQQGSNDEAWETNTADLQALHVSHDKNSGPEYRRIITVHAGKPKGRTRDALKAETDKVRRLSLSEQQIERAAEFYALDLVRFTQKNIVRVYPKGTRFNSSNYCPLPGWLHGAQMVALNMQSLWQGYGRSLWLMQGLFRANGGCGYVRKPDFLMNIGPQAAVSNPEASLPVKITLKVKIYMGDGWHKDFSRTHFDVYSPPDFYAKVEIAGVPADIKTKRTRTRQDDWTPVWGEEFSFPLTVPELALLRIEACEYNMSDTDDFGGQTCLPVWELKPGIRAVPLHDRKGNKYNSVRLLMRFQFV